MNTETHTTICGTPIGSGTNPALIPLPFVRVFIEVQHPPQTDHGKARTSLTIPLKRPDTMAPAVLEMKR